MVKLTHRAIAPKTWCFPLRRNGEKDTRIVTEGSDARGGIKRWGWIDDSRDREHNELIKWLWRMKCQSSLERWQTELSGNPWSWCDSQLPLLSLESLFSATATCRVCWFSLFSFLNINLLLSALAFSFLFQTFILHYSISFSTDLSDSEFTTSLIKFGKQYSTQILLKTSGIVSHLCISTQAFTCTSNFLSFVWFNWTSLNRLPLFKSYSFKN